MNKKDGLFNHLEFLYGKDTAVDFHRVINEVIIKQKTPYPSQRDRNYFQPERYNFNNVSGYCREY